MSLTLESNIKSENEALQLVADTVRNPPQSPAEIIKFAQQNFQITGTITRGIQELMPFAGSVLPLASTIFAAFGAFSGPSIGEQIMSGFNMLSEQISAQIKGLKDYLTELSESATFKTVDLTLEGVNELALEESAVRVMISLEQRAIADQFQSERNRLFDEYQIKVEAMRSEFFHTIENYVTAARTEAETLYANAQAFMADKVLELLRQIDEKARALLAQQSAPGEAMPGEARALPPTPQPGTTPPGESFPAWALGLIVAGAGLAWWRMSKKN